MFGKLHFLFSAFWLLLIPRAESTHIRGGEIIYRSIDTQSLTFEFTFRGYRDSGSIIGFGGGIFHFGDGSYQESGFDIVHTPVDNELEMIEFKVVHSYASSGNYVVSYEEEYRNEGIINMSNSVNTKFYVETEMSIDPFLGDNNSPTLTVPATDRAVVGTLFIHNPGAFDPDGDSLSYRFVVPKQARGVVVADYQELIDPKFYTNPGNGNESGDGVPTLTINESGTITWDAPGNTLTQFDHFEEIQFAEYSMAFIVEEWRKIGSTWYKLGYVTRDMQIIVVQSGEGEGTILDASLQSKNLILYPNPSSGEVRIESGSNQIAQIRVISISGSELVRRQLQEPVVSLRLDEHIKPGTYVLQAFDAHEQLIGVKRLIIVKE